MSNQKDVFVVGPEYNDPGNFGNFMIPSMVIMSEEKAIEYALKVPMGRNVDNTGDVATSVEIIEAVHLHREGDPEGMSIVRRRIRNKGSESEFDQFLRIQRFSVVK